VLTIYILTAIRGKWKVLHLHRRSIREEGPRSTGREEMEATDSE
jgi:hypothetical protein